MAYTMAVNTGGKSVHGNQRVVMGVVTTDAESGVIVTGFESVFGLSIAPVSMNSAGIKIIKNATTGTSASQGRLNIAGSTSGDVFEIVVFGK